MPQYWHRILCIGYCLGVMASAQAQTSSEDGLVWVEALVDVTEPYVQQTLIYTLRVTSTAQVNTLNPIAPMLSGVALVEKLDQQPHFYTHQRQGKNYSISEFRYALTPLTFGDSRIPPATIEVTYSSHRWNNFSYAYPKTQATNKINLQTNALDLRIKPPAPNHQGDWQPLLALTLDGQLENTASLKLGEPFTLTLTTNALGITGAQLPAPQLPLPPEDFKVYSERPQFGQRLVRDDTVLQGWRVDSYTLIPKHAGTLHIPELQIQWWSLREARTAWATWPVHLLSVIDPTPVTHRPKLQPVSPSLPDTPYSSQNTTSGFWWLFTHLCVLALGGWWGAGRPGKTRVLTMFSRVKTELYAQGLKWEHLLRQTVRQYAVRWQSQWQETRPYQVWQSLSTGRARATNDVLQQSTDDAPILHTPASPLYPRTWWHKTLWYLMPTPLRVLHFLRLVDNESEPLRLSRLIQQFAHEQLNTPVNTPLQRLSECFAQRYPGLEAEALQPLFKSLDQLHYDRPNPFKWREWKNQCQQVFRRLPLQQSRLPRPSKQRLLPLNPS